MKEKLALLTVPRLMENRRKMLCKPNLLRLKDARPPGELQFDLTSLHPLTIAMLYGFQLERQTFMDVLVGSHLKKPLHVSEFEDVLAWLMLDDVAVPVPSLFHSEFFDCDVGKNTVLEVWAPRIDDRVLKYLLRSRLTLMVPEESYIQSYKEMVSTIKKLADGAREVRVYVISKFAQPGYLGRFINDFAGIGDVKVYIAVEEPSMPTYFRRKVTEYDNVFYVPTRSHRKIIVIAMRDEEGEWAITGYRGSMNLFFPGVDDYMEAVNDVKDLQRTLHGLIRAFLIV